MIVMRFGGSKCYQFLKPMFIGLIAGDLIAGLMVIVVGGIYYAVTGEPPKSYYVLPG